MKNNRIICSDIVTTLVITLIIYLMFSFGNCTFKSIDWTIRSRVWASVLMGITLIVGTIATYADAIE